MRLSKEDERLLTLFAEEDGISRQEATIRAIHGVGMNGESRKLPSVSATGMPTSWNALVSERTPMVECLTLEGALSLIEDLTVGHSGTSACLTRRCTGL